ncbi:thiol peroxidase [Brachyspira pilosicoli]|uniref:Thiol peroxidase n=1 Tax=Brachyspira pilosicoli TaxID=52584 RepID=A0A5C8FBD4_BRAPL|nr:thiol peroxidase [Brachyspira pilosicoli]TXJ47073.1 thiol peroxidase [Brachyspira pilosicoli]
MKITFQGGEVHLEGVALVEGAKAPDFTGVKTDLSPWSLKDAGDTVKIISSVPSLDTPVCDIQTKRFNKEASSLKGVTVVTVSLDLPFAQARWCAAANANSHIVLSDYAERDFGKKFGTLIKELKLLTRAVFVLDKNNVVKYVQYVPEITNEPDYESVIKAAKELL